MDFEFIDESEIVSTRRGGGRKKKEESKSLFDTPLIERSYWGWQDKGNGEKVLDPGTQIAMALMRSRIRSSVSKGLLLDISNEYPAMRLNKEFIDELIQYQFEFLFDLMSDGSIVARQNEKGEWVIGNA